MTVYEAMLSNAAIAAFLALVALAVGYAARSPILRHAVWLIVLLKLVTPPLFSVPVTVADDVVAQPVWSNWPTAWMLGAWVIGASAWFLWQGRKIVRFRARVAAAEEAPADVAAAANRIAQTLGIARPPAVKLATGIGSPMLWGRGRSAVVLFPRELLPRLSPEARDTLLAHELVHFRRRDHWVRLLEYVVTGLYWWHPAVWLARRGIEAAEEECCDAWVVGGLSAPARRYAEALLATVDFEAEMRRPRLPPGACAANRNGRLLHRRLLRMAQAGPHRRFRGWPAVWLLAAVALVTQPVLRAVPSASAEPDPSPTVKSKTPRMEITPHKTLPPPQRKPKGPRAWATATSPDGALSVLAYDREFTLRTADGVYLALGPGRPSAMSFAPNALRFATVGPGSLVRVWDDHANVLAAVNAPATARAVAHTPDGARLLVLDAAGGVSVYDARSLAPMGSFTVNGPANSITCSPDGGTVAVSFGDWLAETGWVECWSIDGPRKIASYAASVPVAATRYAPDGKILVVAGWNGWTSWRLLPDGESIAERQLSKDVAANTAFCPEAGVLPPEPPPEPPPPTIPGVMQLVGQSSER